MTRGPAMALSTLALLIAGWTIGASLREARPQAPLPAQAADTPTPSATPLRPVADLRDADLVVRHQGQKQLEVHADRVAVEPDLRHVIFVGVARVTLFQEGREALRLHAGKVTLDRQTHDFRVRGPLEITSEAGYHLRAPEASWDAASRTLLFPRGVAMEAMGTTIRASRLIVDLNSRSLLLDGGVDIIFALPGGTP